MSPGIRRLGMLLAFAAGLWAYGEDFGTVSIEALPAMPRMQSLDCYHVYDFRIYNKGTAPAEIYLHLAIEKWERKGGKQIVDRKVLVPPGTAIQTSLFFPVSGYIHFTDFRLRIFINGREVKHTLSLSSGYDYSHILISPSLPYNEYRMLKLLEHGTPTTITVSQWGRHLRNYIGLKRIFLSSEDRLAPQAMEAIMQWVRLGGHLTYCVLPDAAWPEGVPGAETGLYEKTVDWGRISYCRPVTAENRAKVEKFIQRYRGTSVNQIPDESIPDTGPGGKFIRDGRSHVFSQTDIGTQMPDIGAVPFQLIFCVMLVFSILIGPVSFWVLKRKRKEPWVLVTTPLVSLVFCVLVIVFITFNEGWYSRGRAAAITLLDQAEHRAVTRVQGTVYAPVPRGNIMFPMDDCVVFTGTSRVNRLNLDSGQLFSSAMIQPRILMRYRGDRVESRHERLQVRGIEDGQLRVVNGLGGTLNELAVAAPDGQVFQALGPVEAGASVLIPRNNTVLNPAINKGIHWDYINKGFGDKYVPLLEPGHYMAVAETPLFFTPGFTFEQFKVEQYIIGRYEISGEDKNGN